MPTRAEATVIETIAEIFEDKGLAPPRLDAATRLETSLGMDSLDFAELVVRLEAKFGADPFARGAPGRVTTIAQLASLYEHLRPTAEAGREGADSSERAG